MSNVFVITSGASTATEDKEPRLAYKSLVSTSTITASHDTGNTAYLHDGMTSLKWRPAVLSSSLQFDGSFANTDYLAISGVNWASAGCSVTVKDAGAVVIASVSGLRDNQPVLFTFTKGTQTQLLIEFTCTSTNLEVGEVYFGESMQFPKNVSVGYKPGRWSTNDLISSSRTEANQFAGSTVRARGTTESFTINHVPIEFMESEYTNFMNQARGVPIFFLWNKSNANHAVFGNWSASDPTYTSSLLSSIRLNINGVA